MHYVFLQPGERVLRMPTLEDRMDIWAREMAMVTLRKREFQARRLLRENLPRRLWWLLDHPRLLKFVLRLRPSWRPKQIVR